MLATRTCIALAVLLLWAGWMPCAQATEFRASTRTVGQLFEYVRVDGEVVPRQRFTEQVGLHAFDLANNPEHPLNLVVWMRFDTDFGLSGVDRAAYPPGVDRRFDALHLQQASLEAKGLWGAVDVRLGRWLHVDPLGWLDADGVFTRIWLTDALAVHGLAGLEVKQDVLVLNDAAFDPDGTEPGTPGEGGFADNIVVFGGGLRWDDRRWLAAELGYRRHAATHGPLTFDRVERETLGASLELAPRNPLSARASVRYDLFTERLPRTDLSVRQRFEAFEWGVSYLRVIPTFDADSIFNVFDLRAHQGTSLRIAGSPATDWRLAGRIGRRWYEGTEDDPAFFGRLSVGWDAGAVVSSRLMHHTEVGPGGTRLITWLDATSRWLASRWQVKARLQHLYFDVDRNARFDGHGVAAALSGTLRAGPYGRAELRLEEAINPYADHEFRATLLVDLDFLF